jgi:hypothetical protein
VSSGWEYERLLRELSRYSEEDLLRLLELIATPRCTPTPPQQRRSAPRKPAPARRQAVITSEVQWIA